MITGAARRELRPLRRLVQAATALFLAFASCLLTAPAANAASGDTTAGTFTRHTDAAMPYWLYVPPGYSPSTPQPLVVYLQGCNQTVADAALGSRWNAVAQARGFLVAYPEQQTGLYPAQPGNVSQCWNFASPLEWTRTGGEVGAMASVTQRVMATHAVDAARVYVTGVSAGGAMASDVAALYPDLFAAAGVLLGCGFPCGDVTGAGAYNAMAANARRMPVFVAVGAADPVINVGVGEATVMQWLSTNDYVDDQLLNGTVSQTPTTLTQHGFTTPDGNGDPCFNPTGPRKLPCPGGAAGYGSYPYTVRTYDDAQGSLLEYWIIYGLSHAYPGGDPDASFTDPAGPAVTEATYDFFLAHPR